MPTCTSSRLIMRLREIATCLVLVVASSLSPAAPFTPGDIVVYRVGSGTGSLVNTGNAVFLDEFSPAGTLVQSIAMPASATGSNHALVASGTATSEGLLARSADGNSLTLTGYAAFSARGRWRTRARPR